MSAPPLPIVSATSANALLSDVRPTSLAPQALDYINALLDELLVSVVTSAESINYADFRTRGVPAALSESESSRAARGAHPSALGALGRAAVGEAEVEIRSWYAGHPTSQKDVSGFPPDGKGRGMVASREEVRDPFPVEAAVQLMRAKVASLSTFADAQDPIRQPNTDEVVAAWKEAGGDVSEETVAPAALWLTAVLEHICEHILSKLSTVVARDSSIVTATVQDLYTAVCEDEQVYGFFKRMDARAQIESEVRSSSSRTKRGGGPRSASSLGVTRNSPHQTTTPYSSHSSLPSSSAEPLHHHPRLPSSHSGHARPASEQFYKSVINAAKSTIPTAPSHKRASSILSSRQPSASEDEHSTRHPTSLTSPTSFTTAAEDDFDAILRSGETMRVSLTPSRFSTFDNSPNTSPQAKDSTGRVSDHLSAPMSSSESSLLSMSTQASTNDSRVSGYRAAAGRSWSSQQTKLMPRGATIEEKDEDDVLDFHRQSVTELLKSEPRVLRSPVQERLVPAVILGTPIPGPETVDSENDASPTLVSESAVSQRTDRSASETGIQESEVNLTTEMLRGPRVTHRTEERIAVSQETRDLAHFLSTTAPPTSPMESEFSRTSSPPPTARPRFKARPFKSMMSRMSSTRLKEKDEDGFKAWAERTLLPSPSIQTLRSQEAGLLNPSNSSSSNLTVPTNNHSRESSFGLRSQKSHSSVASASTLHGLNHTREASVRSSTETASAGGPMLRRASIVRKWAAQVTHGDHKNSLTRRKSTPLSLVSPLPESEEVDKVSEAGSAPSHPPIVGLGLGITPNEALIEKDYDFEPVQEHERDGTPEAALAALTAGSKSSPSLSRPSTIYSQSPVLRPEAARSVSGPATSVRSKRLRHERVTELREGDDDEPSSPTSSAIGNGMPSSPAPSIRSLGSRHSSSPILERKSLPPRSPASLPARSPASSPRGSVRALPSTSAHRKSLPASTKSPKAMPRTMPASPGSSPASQPTALSQEGYVALADLTPLRTLLDHATTARECQLLLDAMLSQLGVPRAGEGADRVAAWLLGGSPMSSRSWTDKVTRRAPPPPSSAPSSSGRSTRRKKLSPEATMKSLPALPDGAKAGAEQSESGVATAAKKDKDMAEVWDLTSEPEEADANGIGAGVGAAKAVDVPEAVPEVRESVEKAEEKGVEEKGPEVEEEEVQKEEKGKVEKQEEEETEWKAQVDHAHTHTDTRVLMTA